MGNDARTPTDLEKYGAVVATNSSLLAAVGQMQRAAMIAGHIDEALHKSIVAAISGLDEPIAFRQPLLSELFIGSNGVVLECTFEPHYSNPRPPKIILRKVKTYREPVLPADYGKNARFRDSEIGPWSEGILTGFVGPNSGHPWVNGTRISWKYCEVQDG